MDQDFAGSDLARAIADIDGRIKDKGQTLADLQDAIEDAEGALRTELKHQYLAEKRAFIVLNGERQELKRKSLKTRIKFYNRLIRKMERSGAGLAPAKAKFMEDHAAARQRFESSVADIDMKLLGTTTEGESRYSREYAKNLQAIETLVRAINEHPLSQQAELDGKPVDKKDYLQSLIGDAETELALVEQEETVLGYMAKLVALDAMALSDEVAGIEFDDGEDDLADTGGTVTSAVDFFIGDWRPKPSPPPPWPGWSWFRARRSPARWRPWSVNAPAFSRPCCRPTSPRPSASTRWPRRERAWSTWNGWCCGTRA